MRSARMAAQRPSRERGWSAPPVADDGIARPRCSWVTYLYGRGVPPDFQAARKWLQVAANAGLPKRRITRGDVRQGSARRVSPGSNRGNHAVADQRDAGLQLNIGLFYLTGNGIAMTSARLNSGSSAHPATATSVPARSRPPANTRCNSRDHHWRGQPRNCESTSRSSLSKARRLTSA
jgi:hypothetical protein